MIIPNHDIRLAEIHNVRFDVCVKHGRGKQWITVVSNVDLVAAMEKAVSIANSYYESSVITTSGYIYWSSLNPNLFNATVVDIDYLRS